MKNTILFDLDGTLTDPGVGITNSVMYALAHSGIHVQDRREPVSYTHLDVYKRQLSVHV